MWSDKNFCFNEVVLHAILAFLAIMFYFVLLKMCWNWVWAWLGGTLGRNFNWNFFRNLLIPGINRPPILPDIFSLKNLEPCVTLTRAAIFLGPIFRIKVEQQEYVVLSNYDVIKEAFIDKRHKFTGRARAFTVKGKEEVEAVDDSIVLAAHRMIAYCILNDFESGTPNLEQAIKEEIAHFLTALRTELGGADCQKNLMKKSIANTMCWLLFQRRFDYDSVGFCRLNELIELRIGLHSNFSPRHCFPFPAERDCEREGYDENLADLQDQILSAVQDLLPPLDINKGHSFFHAYKINQRMRVIQGEPLEIQTFTDEELLGNTAILMEAGSDCLTLTMMWTAKYLAQFPEVQKKAYCELIEVAGDGEITYQERNRLPYCCATMLEVLRITTIMPLGVARSNHGDVILSGYLIPKHSIVIPNLWAVNHDSSRWADPHVFKPERHLGDNVNITDPQIVSFCLGTRSCPGNSFSQMVYFYYFTMLLKKFRMRAPSDGVKFDIDPGFSRRPVYYEVEFHSRRLDSVA